MSPSYMHFFEDMIADKITINFHYHIHGKSIEQGGEVASDLKRSLKRLGIHPAIVRRAAIATYEAEMNVIIYAEEGRVDVNVEPAWACRTSRTAPGTSISPRRSDGERH